MASISNVSSLTDEFSGWRVALFHKRRGHPINQALEWLACLGIVLRAGGFLFPQAEGLPDADALYLSITTVTTVCCRWAATYRAMLSPEGS